MQTRLASFIEALINVTIGVIVGFIANTIVLPAFGYEVTLYDAFGMALVFTAISLLRSYIIRRFFNGLKFGNTRKET